MQRPPGNRRARHPPDHPLLGARPPRRPKDVRQPRPYNFRRTPDGDLRDGMGPVRLSAARGRFVRWWRASSRLRDTVAAAGTLVAGLVLNLAGLTDVWPTEVERFAAAPQWWHTVLLA